MISSESWAESAAKMPPLWNSGARRRKIAGPVEVARARGAAPASFERL